MKKLFLLSVVLLASSAFANTSSSSPLEAELNSLAVPSDRSMVSTDKLYSIQSRLFPLKNRHELGLIGGKNLNQDGSINSNQFGGLYRYHLSDKWAVGLNYFKVNNELSPAGKKLVNDKGVLPDRDYVKSQTDVVAEYNLFYGKMRFDLDRVVYFDQYWDVGVGQVALGRGNSTAVVVDAGIAFWFGKMMSARMGLKNDFYNEKSLSGGSTSVHNMVGYLSFGILLGGVQ